MFGRDTTNTGLRLVEVRNRRMEDKSDKLYRRPQMMGQPGTNKNKVRVVLVVIITVQLRQKQRALHMGHYHAVKQEAKGTN